MILSDIGEGTDLLDYVESLGYVTFRKKPWDINIIAVRIPGETNLFDDYLYVVYKDELERWHTKRWSVTTDPGRHWLMSPMNVEGTAILVPGQYRRSHRIGRHKGKPALVQVRPLKVYRDSNRDNVIDTEPSTVVDGIFGINIHRAGKRSTVVEKWSAGCIVFSEDDEFEDFMNICRRQRMEGLGDLFTLTLIELT